MSDRAEEPLLVGGKLTDGRNTWRIEKVTKDYVWVSQPGTISIPFPVEICKALRTVYG